MFCRCNLVFTHFSRDLVISLQSHIPVERQNAFTQSHQCQGRNDNRRRLLNTGGHLLFLRLNKRSHVKQSMSENNWIMWEPPPLHPPEPSSLPRFHFTRVTQHIVCHECCTAFVEDADLLRLLASLLSKSHMTDSAPTSPTH